MAVKGYKPKGNVTTCQYDPVLQVVIADSLATTSNLDAIDHC